MHQRNEQTRQPIFPVIATVLIALTVGMIGLSPSVHAQSADVAALEQRVAELNQELERAKADLVVARQEKIAAQAQAQAQAAEAEAELDSRGEPEPARIKVGPVTIGGAMRINYILGSYSGRQSRTASSSGACRSRRPPRSRTTPREGSRATKTGLATGSTCIPTSPSCPPLYWSALFC